MITLLLVLLLIMCIIFAILAIGGGILALVFNIAIYVVGFVLLIKLIKWIVKQVKKK